MKKLAYIQPALKTKTIRTGFLCSLSAPGEGIGNGGEGSNDDDPDVKRHNGYNVWDDDWSR